MNFDDKNNCCREKKDIQKDNIIEQKIENLENIISGLLDEIVTISDNYNIDIHNGNSNYNYYKREFEKIK